LQGRGADLAGRGGADRTTEGVKRDPAEFDKREVSLGVAHGPPGADAGQMSADGYTWQLPADTPGSGRLTNATTSGI
jgi:hypothetical protein